MRLFLATLAAASTLAILTLGFGVPGQWGALAGLVVFGWTWWCSRESL